MALQACICGTLRWLPLCGRRMAIWPGWPWTELLTDMDGIARSCQITAWASAAFVWSSTCATNEPSTPRRNLRPPDALHDNTTNASSRQQREAGTITTQMHGHMNITPQLHKQDDHKAIQFLHLLGWR